MKINIKSVIISIIFLVLCIATVGAALAAAPSITLNNPNNGEIFSSGTTSVMLNVTVTDSDGDNINVTFHDASDDSVICTSNDVSDGSDVTCTWPGLSSDTYNWYVNATDNNSETTISATWSFTIEEAQSSLSLETIELGGDNQERDKTITRTFSLENNGDLNINNIVLTHNIDSEFEFNITPEVISNLAYGSSQNIEFSILVPEDFDAGRYNIGTVTVEGTDTDSNPVTTTSEVYLEAENNLVIDKVTATVDGEDDSVDDGDTVDEEVRPNSDIELEIRVENKGDDEMEDVEVTIESDDDEIGFDDDDEDIGDLDDDDKETVKFSFEADEDIDDGEYDVTITVTGEDENGAEHGEEWTITFEVDKETHEIIIKDIEIKSQGVEIETCDNYFEIEYTLFNSGKKDEDDVSLKIYNNELDYEKYIYNMEIEEGDDLTETVKINLPDDIETGTYSFQSRSYYDNDEESDWAAINVEIKECEEEEEEEDTDEDEEIEVTEPTTPTGQIVYGEPDGFLFRESKWYIGVLSLAIAVIIAGIILMIYNLAKK